MSSALDGLDTRAKAAAILGGRKLDMLERAGLTVVDKQRLEALERLYEAEKSLQEATDSLTAFEASEDAAEAMRELEAMER
jgi:hypothetical protein